MKKKFLAFLMSLVCLLGLCVVLPTQRTSADVGNFAGNNDFDFDFDFGGGYDNNYNNDYNYSYGSIGDSDGDGWIVGLVVVVIIIIYIVSKLKSGKNTPTTPVHRANPPQSRQQISRKPMGEYKDVDPNFDVVAFCNHISNLYVQMQNAWTDKDFTPMRPYFTDTLYSQLERQLESLVRSRQTNYVERISVLSVDAIGWRQVGNNDVITLRLKTRIVDYTLEDSTGKLISGNRTAEKFMTYEWEMSRTSGQITQGESENAKTVNCPNCGAPISVNASAKCQYCGSVITIESSDWVISDMKAISQHTGR